MPKIEAEDKFKSVKLHLDRFWQEIFWRRENEQKVTVWSIGLFGILLTLTYNTKDLNCWPKVIFAIFPLILGIAASLYLYKNSCKNQQIAKLIVKLNESIGAWEEGYLISDEKLYPENWKKWGEKSFRKNTISLWYVILILLASILASIGIMLR